MLLEIAYDATHPSGMNILTKVEDKKTNKGLSGKYSLSIYFDKEVKEDLRWARQNQRKYWQSQTTWAVVEDD